MSSLDDRSDHNDTVVQGRFGPQPDSHTLRALEALIFSAKQPVSEDELCARLTITPLELGIHLTALKGWYQSRGVVLEQLGSSWAFRTASDVAEYLSLERITERKLSRAAMETLSIIAYHQPVTRAEIEEIRGVAVSRGTLDVLLELGWISAAGRRNTLGKPLQWATSAAFLDHFGLASLKDLPGLEELQAAGLLSKRATLNSETLGAMGEDVTETSVFDTPGQDGADILEQPTTTTDE